MLINIARFAIANSNGRFIGITAKSKKGDIIKFNGRIGVTKYLKGGNSTTAHKINLYTIYDVKRGGYRCINLDTIESIRLENREISIK